MSPHILLILREGESPRCVGPFVAALSAQQEATALELREGEFLVQPLVPPVISAQAPRGRHALVPSPVPRDVMCEACGKPYLPTHSSAAPGPTARHPFKLPTEVRDPGRSGLPPLSSMPDLEREVNRLAVTGRPITSWIEEHADQLRRFVPQQLPAPLEDA